LAQEVRYFTTDFRFVHAAPPACTL
jgi:hypothetical protein